MVGVPWASESGSQGENINTSVGVQGVLAPNIDTSVAYRPSHPFLTNQKNDVKVSVDKDDPVQGVR